MSSPVPRRFTIVDGMILVAATAVGFLGMRSGLASANQDRPTRGLWSYDGFEYSVEIFAAFLPVVAAWTLAAAALRLRSPRPSGRRLIAQPGMVGVCAAGGVLVTAAILTAVFETGYRLYWGRYYEPLKTGWLIYYPLVLAPILGVAVASSWAALFAARRWRPEPSWIDRFGRGLGIFWVAMIPALGWTLILLALE